MRPPRPLGLLGGPLKRRPPAGTAQTQALRLPVSWSPGPAQHPSRAGGACVGGGEAGPAATDGAARAPAGAGRRTRARRSALRSLRRAPPPAKDCLFLV